ncbi:MAG: nuclear transport factor 2 family protein [Polymorphobacter sp.]|uniref:nuclear transport factor 2 family protein n=1 Tax=Polymorphobacter sp. TaxID=1909290 RepID=UPI003A8597B9
MTLEDLLSRAAIADVLHNYAKGADRGDVSLIAPAYHDDAIEDHGGTFLGPAADYLAGMAKILPTAPRMTHMVTNLLIDVDGSRARAESYWLTFSRREGEAPFDSLTMARILDKFENRGDGWKIAHRRLTWEWNHEMPLNESWGRGQIAPDPARLVRGAKKPDDLAYSDWWGGK